MSGLLETKKNYTDELQVEKIYFPFQDHKKIRDKMFELFSSNPEFRTNPYTTEMSSSEMKDLLAKQQKILMLILLAGLRHLVKHVLMY